MKRLDLTGHRYGRLTVTRYLWSKAGYAQWLAKCECGEATICVVASVRAGLTRSCGCLRRETTRATRLIHGCAGGRTYRAWKAMKTRCYRTKGRDYKNYGGRGIKVCDRWLNNFPVFLSDMGEIPPGYSLERINVNDGYRPENCKWIPRQDQSRNKRQTVHVLLNGERMIKKDAAIRLNVTPGAIYSWLKHPHRIPVGVSLVKLTAH